MEAPSVFFPLDLTAEYYMDERCHIVEVLNNAADPHLSIARARVEPGVTTRWHCVHGTVERYVIQAGYGLMELGDLPPQAVGPGDVVLIPAGWRQRITNAGSDDLIFLAICTPRFRFESYADVDPEPLPGKR
ncbi:MAG TPA: cupin domain-containing protein [Rhodocyclaceae bacterium]|nr:cupin domain-containing protein [Rhodocyclaceae bacterium]